MLTINGIPAVLSNSKLKYDHVHNEIVGEPPHLAHFRAQCVEQKTPPTHKGHVFFRVGHRVRIVEGRTQATRKVTVHG